jgi:hypothetical protein
MTNVMTNTMENNKIEGGVNMKTTNFTNGVTIREAGITSNERFLEVLAQVREAKNNIAGSNVLVISSKVELENYYPMLMEMNRTHVMALNVRMESAEFELNEQAVGYIHEDATLKTITVKTRTGVRTEQGIDKYVKIHVKNDKVRKNANANGMYINPQEAKAYILRNDENGDFYDALDVMKGGKVVSLTAEEITMIKDTFGLIRGIDFSASDLRVDGILYMDITKEDTRNTRMNELSFGAYEKVEGQKFPQKDITSAVNRLGQNNGPSTDVGEIGNDTYGVMLLHGTLDTDLYLGKGIFKENQPTFDGEVTGNAAYLAEAWSVKLSIKFGRIVIISEDAVQGLQTQDREGLAKESTWWKRPSGFSVYLKNVTERFTSVDAAGNTVQNFEIIGNPNNIVKVIDADAMKKFCGVGGDYNTFKMRHRMFAIATPSTANTSMSQMISKVANLPGFREELGDMVDIIAHERVEKLFPEEGAKPCILSRSEALGQSGMYAEVIAKIDREANYRLPAILRSNASMLVKQATKEVGKIKVRTEGKFLRILMDDSYLMLTAEEFKTIRDLGETGIIREGEAYAPAFTRWYAGELAKYKAAHEEDINAAIAEIEANESLTKQLKSAAKRALNKEIESAAAIDKRGFFIKFPSPSKCEVYNFVHLTTDEIKERIKSIFYKAENGKEIINLLINNILDLGDGSILFPASDILKNKLAGMDLDFDGGQDYWGRLAKYFAQIPNVAVKIGQAKKVEVAPKTTSRFSVMKRNPCGIAKEYVINVDNGIAVGYDGQKDNNNAKVGKTTNDSYTFSATISIEDKMKALKISIKALGGRGKYESVFDQADHKTIVKFGNEDMVVYFASITDSEIVAQRIKDCDISTEENLDIIYRDIDILFRVFQESIIDADKKGEKVAVNFVLSKFKPLSLIGVENNFNKFVSYLQEVRKNTKSVDSNEEHSQLAFYRKDYGNAEVFEDVVSSLQDDMGCIFEEAFSTTLTEAFSTACLSDAEMKVLNVAYDKFEVADDINQVVKKCFQAISMQNAKVLSRISEQTAEGLDSRLAKEMVANAAADYKRKISYVSNLTNQLVEGLDVVTAGKVIMAASILEKDGKLNPMNTSSMPYTIGYVYSLAKTINEVGITKTGCQLVTGTARHTKAGDVLVFSNGIATAENGKNVIAKGERITGEYTIHEEDGQFWAVQDFSVSDIEAARPEINTNEVTFKFRRAFNVERAIKGDVVLYDSKEATPKDRKKQDDALALDYYENTFKCLGDALSIKLVPRYEYDYKVGKE